jgi:hypothetical protein
MNNNKNINKNNNLTFLNNTNKNRNNSNNNQNYNKNNNKRNNRNKNTNSINNLLTNDDYQYVTTDTLIVIIGIFIVIVILIYAYKQYQRYKNVIDQTNKSKKEPGTCPDYWLTVDKNTCRNEHKIGKCGRTGDVAFTDKMFTNPKTGDYMKCRWSKECEAPWENISDLC